MSFKINTNVYALTAHAKSNAINSNLSESVEKLSSGLRINKAADDASGMAIANSLRMQSSGLTQAIKNANSAVSLLQIADNAMEEMGKILTTVKAKAVQAAEDGQTRDTRLSLQKDVNRLLEGLDNISKNTTFNGQNLLSGAFSSKEFQVGSYSNETVNISIASTDTDHIGHSRIETFDLNSFKHDNDGLGGNDDIALGDKLFLNLDGTQLHSVVIDNKAGTGIGTLADLINSYSDTIGASAAVEVEIVGAQSIDSGLDIDNLKINGVTIGNISGIVDNDSDGKLVNAINAKSDQTGVTAYVDEAGKLHLNSQDGRAIRIESDASSDGSIHIGDTTITYASTTGTAAVSATNIADGALTINGTNIGAVTVLLNDSDGALVDAINAVTADTGVTASLDGSNQLVLTSNTYEGDIVLGGTASVDGTIHMGDNSAGVTFSPPAASGVTEYGELNITSNGADDIKTIFEIEDSAGSGKGPLTAGDVGTPEINNLANVVKDTLLTTGEGAQKAMDIVDAAMKALDTIRSDIGSAQMQLTSTLANLTITNANVQVAEGVIRDVDFAEESANFNKNKLLAQAGTFAMSQSNTVQENVMTLLR
ncbi:flagellin B [bacterium]|jgi:flagellin|nr:flagellin B [bacterium]